MRNKNKHKLYPIWDQVPVDYYQRGINKNILQKIWHTRKYNLCKKTLKNIKFLNCLEVGCASGHLINEISKSFPKVKYTGVDIYDKAIKYAKLKYPGIEFKVADAQELPFKDNSFDLILNYETLEHVENPYKTLLELKRILRKKGTLVLAMDSGRLLFRIVWKIWENTRGDVWRGSHLNCFHYSELEALIKKAGLKINKRFFSHLGMEITFVLKKT